jgi:hypothetical protein
MIRLTDETKIDKNGREVNNSLFLVRIDSNNLALQRAGKTENYFGDVRIALNRSLNYVIKGSQTALSLEFILDAIQSLDGHIQELKSDAIEIEPKGAKDE